MGIGCTKWTGIAAKRLRLWVVGVFALVCLAFAAGESQAGTPISLYLSLAGNLNWVGTAGTLRTQPDGAAGAACTVTNSGSATLSGIPVGATVRAAYLYWAGSYSTVAGSTRTTPDYNVTFDGQAITADRTFTESFPFSPNNLDFFSGFKDVTSQVVTKGNGSYSFADLTVNTATPHCAPSAVLSGWALVVVYDLPSEPLRVLNLYDGFEYYRGSSITFDPSNFRIPTSGIIDAKHGHITWEGDAGNSGSLNGFVEDLRFNGSSLIDALNPANNQFNSTINFLGSSTAYGVAFDIYDVPAVLLVPGSTTATTVYSSGQDLVLLSAEILSVTNSPVIDLALTKTHSGDFTVGSTGSFQLTVSSSGPSTATHPITVTDTLPAGLTYQSSSGSGWTVDTSALPTVQWTHPGPLAPGASLPPITLVVNVASGAVPGVTNSATAAVTAPDFDNNLANNTANDPVTVRHAPQLTMVKSVSTLSDPVNGATNPKAIPGAEMLYSMLTSNFGLGTVDTGSLIIVDPIPPNASLFVGDLGAGTAVLFLDGAVGSGLVNPLVGSDVSFSLDGSNFSYTPAPDGDGYDSAVRYLRITPRGIFNASDGVNNPSFTLRFKVRID